MLINLQYTLIRLQCKNTQYVRLDRFRHRNYREALYISLFKLIAIIFSNLISILIPLLRLIILGK